MVSKIPADATKRRKQKHLSKIQFRKTMHQGKKITITQLLPSGYSLYDTGTAFPSGPWLKQVLITWSCVIIILAEPEKVMMRQDSRHMLLLVG